MIRLALVCSLLASAAQAQHFASDKQVELRVGASLLWYASSNVADPGSSNTTIGMLPVELGVGFRPTPDTSIALTARLGLIHFGFGLELSKTFAGDWGRDGLLLRVSPQVIRDFVTCFSLEGPRPCDTATYLVVEAGVAYRWAFRSTGGFSIGGALTAGQQRLDTTGGPTDRRFVYGFLAPRFMFDF